jgi:hypothetical protein
LGDAEKGKVAQVDGFPRSLDRAKVFEDRFGKPFLVVSLSFNTGGMDRGEDIMHPRCQARADARA